MAYDPANTYATVASVEKRLTTHGRLAAVDVDDHDGSEDAGETEYIEESVEYANQMIDESLLPHVGITPRPRNRWLADRCVDLAAYRVQTLGGREADTSIADDYERALAKLEAVFRGDLKVPGLDYTHTLSNGRMALQVMRAINVK